MKGISPRNPKYMRAFAEAWREEAIVQAVLAQITWHHNDGCGWPPKLLYLLAAVQQRDLARALAIA